MSPKLTQLVLLVALVSLRSAHGQTSSIFQASAHEQGLTLENSSLLFQAAEPFHTVGLQSPVMIVVSASDQVRINANLQRRRTLSGSAVLNDWVKLAGGLKLDPQTGGDPKVSGDYATSVRDQADLQTGQSVQFKLSGKVVDIKPNGMLVLEAHDTITDNEEVSIYSVTGSCRPQDIEANNQILSERIVDLEVKKANRGQIRDGYKRGWVYALIDKYRMF
jgi:flagellar L-ring protein precursor FlgH